MKIILFYIFISCAVFDTTAQSISVNDSYTAQQLVENILVNSSCANVSNIKVKGDPFSGSQNSYGYFKNQGGSFPFTEGVLLSTWSSKNSEGPFVRSLGAGNFSWQGDADLEQALGITNTINATVLEFDFIPLTNFISFEYIFASNEYQDYFPCVYSDAFAFLIKKKGSTDSYTNLAVIPNTQNPVSSTSIHPTIPNFISTTGPKPGCPAVNENYFEGFNTLTSPINYAGQTKVLIAQTNVVSGTTYHIKLVIADGKDEFGATNRYQDSAVFLKAGSFSSKIYLGPDRLLTGNNPVCFGEDFIIDTKLSASYNYKWYKNGAIIPIPGEITPSLKVTDTGTYKVEVALSSPQCIATGEIKIEFTPQIILNNTTLVQCDENGDGIANFDLNKAEAIIKNNNSNLPRMLFFENRFDAQNNQNPISSPKSYTNISNNQIVIAKVLDNYGCPNYAELTLSISSKSIAPLDPIVVCDDDGFIDGIHQFDLMGIATSGYFSGIGNNIFVSFYLNLTDAYLEKNELPFFFKNTIPYQQTIYARVLNGSDCYAITPITLVVNTFDPPNFQEENAFLCNGTSINLAVDAGFSSYLWSTGASSNTITVNTPGDYSVTVTNFDGCQKTKKYHVITSGIATITDVTVNDFERNENSISIEYTGIGDYEFSIDGTFFQDNPIFNGIAPGEYLVYARDKNGCGLSVSYLVYVLDYPRYFTPNNDGYNDLWQIKNLDNLPQSTLFIFDRYGKLLKQLISSDIGWNGTFNGFTLPTDDYWFHLNLENGRIIKGHFSLKR